MTVRRPHPKPLENPTIAFLFLLGLIALALGGYALLIYVLS